MTDGSDARSDDDRRRRRRGASLAERNPAMAEQIHALLTLALCLILLWAPLPLGSNRPFYLSLLALMAGGALMAWAIAASSGMLRVSQRVTSLWPAAVAFLLAMGIAAVQIVDLRQVDGLLGTQFSRDLAHPLWQLAGDALGTPLPAYVSVNPAKADPAFVKSFIYASVFFLAFVLARQTWSARAMLTTVAAAGALCVGIGFIQSGLGFNLGETLADEVINDPSKVAQEHFRFAATFTNPNHLATFAGIAFLAAAGLAYEAISKGIVLNRGREIAIRTAILTMTGPALLALFFAGLAASGIVASMSRAGALSVLVGALVLTGILYFTSRSRSGGPALPGTLGLAAAAVAIGAVFVSTPLLTRIDRQGFEDSPRLEIALATADAITAAPLTGNGFGAFIDYYPLYARETERATVNKAHNDYLEALSDLGVAGGVAMVFVPLYLAFLAGRGIIRRRRGKMFGAVAVAAAALCGVHAVFDFSLQIPAVGVFFYTVLGIGAAQAWRGEDEDAGDPRMSA
jgi:hypothetical protein